MNYQSIRGRVLTLTEGLFPWILGIAFAFSNIPRFYWIGIWLLLFSALWFSVWNFRGVFSSRWALLVIVFFAAIALKDGVLWAVGSGRFDSFAKSGSRIVSLFGAAAMPGGDSLQEGLAGQTRAPGGGRADEEDRVRGIPGIFGR